jgi:hypothetical protein
LPQASSSHCRGEVNRAYGVPACWARMLSFISSMDSRFRLSARDKSFVTLLHIPRGCCICLALFLSDSCVGFDVEARSGAAILLAVPRCRMLGRAVLAGQLDGDLGDQFGRLCLMGSVQVVGSCQAVLCLGALLAVKTSFPAGLSTL